MLDVAHDANVTLSGVTIQGGKAAGDGSGLRAGAGAAHVAAAVLLTAGSTQASETAAYLAAHAGDHRWAVGGPAEAADPGATGVAGGDRYATSVAVATTFFTAPTTVGIASGQAFADALSGGADIASAGGPLLLTDPVSLSSAVAAYLNAGKATLTSVLFYGGPSAIADQVVTAASVTSPGPQQPSTVIARSSPPERRRSDR